MTMTNLNMSDLRRRWKHAILLGNEADYMKAEIAREIYDAWPGSPEDAKRMLTTKPPGGLGLASRTATMATEMAAAIQVVPDRAVWLMGGWKLVRTLAGLPAAQRKRDVAKLLKTTDGKRMSREEVKVYVGDQEGEEHPERGRAPGRAEAPRRARPALEEPSQS
jgi:hypothetical protein